MDDVGRLDAVQDHVHDGDDVGQRLLFLAVEGALLQGLDIRGGEARPGLEIVEGLAQETCRTDGAVIDALTDLRLDHLDDGADQRTGGVILAAVAPGVAHVPDFGLVEVGQLVLLGLGAEAQLVDVVDDVAQDVAAADLVLDLAEYLADFELNGVRPGRLLLETVQIGKELTIHKVAQIVVRQGLVVVELAVGGLGTWGRPNFPSDTARRG